MLSSRAASLAAATTERRSRRSISSGVGQRRLGAVVPLGDAELGQQVLGERHERLGFDLGLALGAKFEILLLDLLTEGRHASTKHFLRDRALFFGEFGQHRVTMGAARTKSLGPGLGRLGRRPRRSLRARRTLAAIGTLATVWARRALRSVPAFTGGTAGAVARGGSCPIAVGAVGSAFGSPWSITFGSISSSGRPIAAIVAAPRRLFGKRADYWLELGAVADDGNALRFLPRDLRGEHLQNGDAVEVEVGVDAHGVADLGAVGQ